MGDPHSDILEVRILDSTYRKVFKAKARIGDKKELANLIYALEQKGVKLTKNENISWFD